MHNYELNNSLHIHALLVLTHVTYRHDNQAVGPDTDPHPRARFMVPHISNLFRASDIAAQQSSKYLHLTLSASHL